MENEKPLSVSDEFIELGRKIIANDELSLGVRNRYLRGVHGIEEGDRIYAEEQRKLEELEAEFPTQISTSVKLGNGFIVDVFKRTDHDWECWQHRPWRYNDYGSCDWLSVSIESTISNMVEDRNNGETLSKIRELYETGKGNHS